MVTFYIYLYVRRHFSSQKIFVVILVYSTERSIDGKIYSNDSFQKRRYHRSSSSSLKRHKFRVPDLRRPKPYFDIRIDKDTGYGGRNITTVEGGRAVLICRIRNLGPNRTVS